MSNQYLSFDVTKQSSPQQLITGRQGDSQLKFVSVLLWDGEKNIPYDLTGKQVAFESLKPDNNHIVDYEGITILDAPHGLFRYSFNEQVFAVAGKMQQAFFKITHTDNDNNVIADSTLEVAINILENRVEFGINSTDYLSEYDDLITKVKQKFDDYAATVHDSIDKAQQVHDEVNELLSQVDGIQATIRRRVAVKDSNTISLSQNGNWDTDSTTTLSAEVKLSAPNQTNALIKKDDGLFVPNGEIGIPTLRNIINGDNIRDPQMVEFILSPYLVRNSVMQQIYYDIPLGQWFITQSDGLNPEGFVMSRLNAGGVLISNMHFKKCGHGTGVIFKSEQGENPMVYFQQSDHYNSVRYQDDTTVIPGDTSTAFTPPANGNGMSAYNDMYFTHINNQSEINTLNIYKYIDDNGDFKFENILASIDISEQIVPDKNALQGLSIINKKDVTGEDTDHVYLLVMAGMANVNIDILLYEFNPLTKDIVFVKAINELQNLVIPTTDEANVNWNFFEAEGLQSIVISDGVSKYAGVMYGITTNILGKRKQYIYGFTNAKLSKLLADARSSISDTRSVQFVYGTETELSSYTTPGEYELSAALAIKYDDFPSNWRGVNSQTDWILRVSHKNQNGDIVQELIRRGVGSPMEYYIRTLNFTAGYYGKDYKPSAVGYWNVVNIDGQQARTLTSTNNVLFRKLSDFAIPNTSYYVSSNSSKEISDFEGLADYLAGRAFKITTSSWSGSASAVLQKVETIRNGSFEVAVRTLLVKKDTYGPGMILNTDDLPKWTIFTGTNL